MLQDVAKRPRNGGLTLCSAERETADDADWRREVGRYLLVSVIRFICG
jgi:hypothetical protein